MSVVVVVVVVVTVVVSREELQGKDFGVHSQ